MASVNKVILIGHLGQDPETRYLPSGDPVTNISVATTEKWKDKGGEQREHTEWFAITFFGKLAEIAGEYLKKGALVYVEGRIRTDKWEKDGQTHYRAKVIADRLQMLGGKREESSEQRGGQGQSHTAPAQQGQQKTGGRKGAFDDMEDDIPF